MWKPPRFPGQTFSFYKKCPQHADLKLCLWLKYQGWFLVRSHVLCIVTIEAWQSHSSRSESRSLIFLPFLCVCNALEFFLRKKRGLGLLSNAFSYNPVFYCKMNQAVYPKVCATGNLQYRILPYSPRWTRFCVPLPASWIIWPCVPTEADRSSFSFISVKVR